MATSENVTTGKPNVAGAIYVETASTSSLPTTADGQITGFNDLGYAGEDGLTNANTFDSTDIKEWGGATVLSIGNNYADKFRFILIEALNPNVLKEVFGASNVTGSSLSSGISIAVKPTQHDAKKWIFDMIMRGNVLKRICLPAAAISEVQEIVYTNDNAVGYGVTLTCYPDSSGNTHYEYLKTKSTTP